MKNVLILGATSDMAIALAKRFAGEKYSITLAARDPSALRDVARDIELRTGTKTAVLDFDALKTDSHAAFYQGLEPKPTIVISVFGYLGDQILAEHDFKEARRILDTNYMGAISILNIAANDFENKEDGCIIGISSVAGERGRQSNYLYGSAKAGFTAYLSGLRNRLCKKGVHVMTVKPGFVRTKMTADMELPARLTADPERAAEDIYRAYRKRINVVYTLWMWRYIMFIIRMIPEPIFKRLNM